MKKFILYFLCLASSAFCAKGTFSPITPYPSSYSDGILDLIYPTYIPKYDKVFLSWAGGTTQSDAKPFFALYDCKKNTFSNPQPTVEADYNSGVKTFTSSCYSPINDFVFLAYSVLDTGISDAEVFYQIYDCKNNYLIPLDDIFIPNSKFSTTSPACTFNPYNNTIFITWSGLYQQPTYAVFDCASMTFLTQATLLFDSALSSTKCTI